MSKVRNVGIIQSCLLVGILGSRVFSGLLADEWAISISMQSKAVFLTRAEMRGRSCIFFLAMPVDSSTPVTTSCLRL